MGYSFKPELHSYKGQDGLHAVLIRMVYNRTSFRIATVLKLKENQLLHGEVVKHPNANNFNKLLRSTISKIEAALIDEITLYGTLTREQIKRIIGSKPRTMAVNDFIIQFMTDNPNNVKPSRMRHYTVLKNKLEEFRPGSNLSDIDQKFTMAFQKWLSAHCENNTVWAKIAMLKVILKQAVKDRVINEYPLRDFKAAKYIQTIPQYLTEEQIEAFKAACDATTSAVHKLSGYYFLLACYAGYRISDLVRFDYGTMVKDGSIILQASKNKNIVSIPVYPKLKKILSFIKDKPYPYSEKTMRLCVKDLAPMAGIKQDIKIHSSRHSFAMLLMKKGFSQEEAASLLGDSINVSRIYARIDNQQLKGKIMERFK